MTQMSYVDNYVDFGDFFLKKVEGKKNKEGNIKFLFCKSFLSDIAKYWLGQIMRAKIFLYKNRGFCGKMKKVKKSGNGILELGGTIICGHMKAFFIRSIHWVFVERLLKTTAWWNQGY